MKERPSEASMPTSAGRMISPREITFSPRRTSSPARRMFWPCAASTKMATRPPSFRVSSIRTTASAPSGTGAPVMIRAACPGPIGFVGMAPAGISSTTSRRTGFPGDAPRISSAAEGVAVHRRVVLRRDRPPGDRHPRRSPVRGRRGCSPSPAPAGRLHPVSCSGPLQR